MFVFKAVLLMLVPLVASQSSTCGSDSPECLQTLRKFLTSTDWWFGDSYSSKCSNVESNRQFSCMNPDIQHKSIISRVFQTDNFDVGNITQVLHIRFYVPGGSYRACGHVFNVPSVYMDQDLDFSQPVSLDSWSLQTRPAITWDPEPGVIYAIIAYNIDLMQLAGLWVNIRGGDSSLGYELYSYSGPMCALNRTSFHVFLLFKQNNVIDEAQVDLIRQIIGDEIRYNHGVYRLGNLLDVTGQTQNLMGVGLISVGADPYGIEKHKSRYLHNNCPWLVARMRPVVKDVLMTHGLTALGADVSNLEVELEVRYKSDAISYTSCCRNHSESARDLNLDPLSLTPVSPVFVRTQPFVRLSAVNMMDPHFFFDKKFTLAMLDVTAATNVTNASRRASLHWLVADIHGAYPSSGHSLKAYTMPVPQADLPGSSLYIFFVFSQNRTLGNVSWNSYCDQVNTNGGCDFLLEKFVRENSLHLSGINLLWSQPDRYSRLKMYESDPKMADNVCAGVAGYGRPCPDPCAQPIPAATTAAPGNTPTKPSGVTATMTTSNSRLLFSLLLVSVLATRWRIT